MKLFGRIDHAHSFSAAARCGLDEHRVADAVRLFDDDLRVFRGRVAGPAGHDGHAGIGEELLGGELVAHRPNDLRLGSDERDARIVTGLGEFRVLGEESVAGVDGVDIVLFGDFDDSIAAEVRLRRSLSFEGIGFIGGEDVRRSAVGLGIDRDGAQAHLLDRLGDADGDFSAVGDKDALEHIRSRSLGHCGIRIAKGVEKSKRRNGAGKPVETGCGGDG